MADTEIKEAIRSYLTRKDTRGFHLEFDYNGIHYKTYFDASHDDEAIVAKNKCIHIAFEYMYNKFIGRIDGDSAINKCFEPTLVTNARNKPGRRTTAADVLQILKTKLSLSFPTIVEINLVDGAMNNRILIAPFNILRGGDAFYEKYGYKSSAITDLKAKIQTFPWSSCNDAIRSVIQDCTGSDWPPETRLMDIMKTISWEQEKAYNNVKGKIDGEEEEDFIHPSLSYRVFRHFATIAGGIPYEQSDQFRTDTIWEFLLDRDSPQWKRCDAELVFTKFTPVLAGGNRSQSRKKQRKQRATRRK